MKPFIYQKGSRLKWTSEENWKQDVIETASLPSSQHSKDRVMFINDNTLDYSEHSENKKIHKCVQTDERIKEGCSKINKKAILVLCFIGITCAGNKDFFIRVT